MSEIPNRRKLIGDLVKKLFWRDIRNASFEKRRDLRFPTLSVKHRFSDWLNSSLSGAIALNAEALLAVLISWPEGVLQKFPFSGFLQDEEIQR